MFNCGQTHHWHTSPNLKRNEKYQVASYVAKWDSRKGKITGNQMMWLEFHTVVFYMATFSLNSYLLALISMVTDKCL